MHKHLKGRMACAEMLRINSGGYKDYITTISAFADAALYILKSGDRLEKEEEEFLIEHIDIIRNTKGFSKSACRKLVLYVQNPLLFRIYVKLRQLWRKVTSISISASS